MNIMMKMVARPASTQSSHPPTFPEPEQVVRQWTREIEIENGRRKVEEWKKDE
jgi:hypothetical protein